jgi:hypothetical protein
VNFVKAHERIDLSLDSDAVNLAVTFTGRSPLFDFADYTYANPNVPSLAEITQFGANQQSIHLQQGMYANGSVSVKSGPLAGREFEISSYGYRDHSRMVRCDNMTKNHFWTGMHFPGHVFGVMSLTGLLRPNSPANCGYVWDEQLGLRSLRKIEMTGVGTGPEGVPAAVEVHLTDIHDNPFTIVADLTNRYAHVPLHTEAAGAAPFIYDIVENMAPLTLKETGDTGVGIVEVGWSTPAQR